MDATIGYLQEVREDLLAAGARTERRRPTRPSRFGWRPAPRILVAALSVASVVAAGTVGWFVTRDDAKVVRVAAGQPEEPAPSPADVPGARARQRLALDHVFGNFTAAESDALVTGYVDPQSARVADLAGTQLPGEFSRVIRTAEMGLEIPRDAFDDRFGQLVGIASANEGFVADSSARERSGSVTLRVPAGRFAETLREVRALGTVQAQSVRGKDVTAQYIDLQARTRIAKSRREVLLGLMQKAVSIEQTIRVQNALDETQLRIEELQGQVRLLDDRVSLSTVWVSLHEQGVVPRSEVETPSLPNAFERSVAGFVGVIAGIVIGLGYVVPVLAIGLVAWFVVARVRRRRQAA